MQCPSWCVLKFALRLCSALLVAGPPVGSSAAIDAAGVDTDTQRANLDKTSFDMLLHGLAIPADVTAAAYFRSNESFASSVESAASSIVEYQGALNRYCATRKETAGATHAAHITADVDTGCIYIDIALGIGVRCGARGGAACRCCRAGGGKRGGLAAGCWLGPPRRPPRPWR